MLLLAVAPLLAVILLLFAPALQRGLQTLLYRRPALLWLAPALLTIHLLAVAAALGAFSAPFALLIAAYTTAPVLAASLQRPGPTPRASALDFAIILLLWLPLEFAAGASLVPRPAQGALHAAAYGVAIVLALVIFLGYRASEGLKYQLPARARDLWLPFAVFAIAGPTLILLGRAVGFIQPFHFPGAAPSRMALTAVFIFLGTALPEEILFRALIQNFLMQRLGPTLATRLLAAVIFGCAHLNNGPQALPNWRYALVATVAGFAFGTVFQKARSVCSSAILHTLVDWTKRFYF